MSDHLRELAKLGCARFKDEVGASGFCGEASRQATVVTTSASTQMLNPA